MEKKYIDAEEFKRRVMESAFEANKPDLYDIAKGICEMVDFTPAADVAPVVHGEWIDKGEFYPPCHDYKCSVCKKSERMAEHKHFLFCPNCGADMRKDENGNK